MEFARLLTEFAEIQWFTRSGEYVDSDWQSRSLSNWKCSGADLYTSRYIDHCGLKVAVRCSHKNLASDSLQGSRLPRHIPAAQIISIACATPLFPATLA